MREVSELSWTPLHNVGPHVLTSYDTESMRINNYSTFVDQTYAEILDFPVKLVASSPYKLISLDMPNEVRYITKLNFKA